MMIRRGIVRGFDPINYVASVQLVGSTATYLPSIRVAEHIAAAEMVDGAECAVLFFDELDPEEAVVLATYGGTGTAPAIAVPMEAFIALGGNPPATTLGPAGDVPRVWSLPDSILSAIGIWVAIPSGWGSNFTLRVTVHYTAAVTAGNAKMRIRAQAVADNEDLTAGPGTTDLVVPAPATANNRKSFTVDFPSGVDGGDAVRLSIVRLGADAADTLSGAVLVVRGSVARV